MRPRLGYPRMTGLAIALRLSSLVIARRRFELGGVFEDHCAPAGNWGGDLIAHRPTHGSESRIVPPKLRSTDVK